MLVRIEGDDIVHEGEELDAPAAFLVSGGHLAGGQIECGKQRGGAVPLVVVTVAAERAPVGQLEVALRPLQRLDGRLLVDADDDRLVGRGHVEADHIGRLGGEFGIVALAPRFPAVEIDRCPRRKRQTCCS